MALERSTRKLERAALKRFLSDLAPGGVCLAADVTTGAVSSYLTLSPLPLANQRRFTFCGTFPHVAVGGR